ncbi:hypothetical protein N7533_013469 [Penicillium manginii]|uniref:uncharacterized protein n=1 Tax=Penicillium manginii TaxID=203109 RepID=UPI00254801D4|nr:uncharacterized protein N7533_013469 [Penicillium manginii]KAJ5733022.1 hypothetical protein N7533_013469 [Penicillium manginii]
MTTSTSSSLLPRLGFRLRRISRLPMFIDMYEVATFQSICEKLWAIHSQPPFDTGLPRPILIGQMRNMMSDDLPERWKGVLDTRKGCSSDDEPGRSLQTWLENINTLR